MNTIDVAIAGILEDTGVAPESPPPRNAVEAEMAFLRTFSLGNIIARKISGVDCTEAESDDIKHLVHLINKHFPLEFDEYVYECAT